MYSGWEDVKELVLNQNDDLDYSLALEYMGGSIILYKRLVEMYVKENKNLSIEMKEKLNEGKYYELYQNIHNIKGLSLNFGSRILFSFSEYLCKILIRSDCIEFEKYEKLDEEIELFIEFYDICIRKLEKSTNND